jgi:hypothetical protein
MSVSTGPSPGNLPPFEISPFGRGFSLALKLLDVLVLRLRRANRSGPRRLTHSLVHAHVGLLQPIYKRFLLGSDLCGKRRSEPFVEHQQLVDRH